MDGVKVEQLTIPLKEDTWRYGDRLTYQGRPGRYLGRAIGKPDCLYIGLDDGEWGVFPIVEIARAENERD